MNNTHLNPSIAIACGGTGGHLFPGLAVAEELKKRGCNVALLVSPKDVDRQAVKSAQEFEIFTLPAVGLQNRNYFSFALSFWKSFRVARKLFCTSPTPFLARPIVFYLASWTKRSSAFPKPPRD